MNLDGIFAVLEKNRLMFVVLSIVECGHFDFHELLNHEVGPPKWGKKISYEHKLKTIPPKRASPLK